MEPSENQLREAARAVRPHLERLVGKADALTLDAQFEKLIAQGEQGTEVGPNIHELLGRKDETRKWLQVFLETGSAPPNLRGYEGLPDPGSSASTPGKKFVCPDGDYEWYRPFVGFPVPKCPKHGKDLVRAL